MKGYKNQVWDMIDNFYEAFNIFVVLREFNQPTDSLAVAANTFKVPATPQVKYEIEMRYIPSIPIQYQILDKFLKMTNKSKGSWK
jgi:hypothetical protein